MELALWLSKRAHDIVVYGQSKSLKRAPTGKEPVVVLETLQGQDISQEYPDPFPEHLCCELLLRTFLCFQPCKGQRVTCVAFKIEDVTAGRQQMCTLFIII